jgi:hypothetical protein
MQCACAILPSAVCTAIQHFPLYLIHCTIAEKKSFFYNFCLTLSHSKHSSARYDRQCRTCACTVPVCCVVQTVMLLQLLWANFRKILKYRISIARRVVPLQTGRQTDRHDEADSHCSQFCQTPSPPIAVCATLHDNEESPHVLLHVVHQVQCADPNSVETALNVVLQQTIEWAG